MRGGSASRQPEESGAAAVEFGLVAVILLTLLIGIIQFAIFFWAYQVGAHSAREGARLAAVSPCDEAAVMARVTSRADGAYATPPVVDVSPPATMQVGEEITVSVEFDVHEIGLFSGLPTIQKSATARIEHVPAGGC